MVALTAGSVVLLPFPFSDLSHAKRRPAVVLAEVDRGDWIFCQITSQEYGDARALLLEDGDFREGSLRLRSFVRPGKLFTGHHDLVLLEVGRLTQTKCWQIVDAIIGILRAGTLG